MINKHDHMAIGYVLGGKADKVFDCFDAIAATTKRTEKHQLLASMAKSKTMHTLLSMVFGKHKYYITAKSVEYTGKASITKHRFSTTDEALEKFVHICWLLHANKISGNAAKETVNEFFAAVKKSKDIHKNTHKWLLCILDKNLRIGIDTSVQEIFPDIIEAFGIPKGIALIEQKTGKMVPRAVKMITYPCEVEPKKDGFNISFVCDLENNTVKAVSSDNEELPALRRYAKTVLASVQKHLQDIPAVFGRKIIVIDGEVESSFNPKKQSDASKWKSSWGKTSALCKAGIKKTGFDADSIDEEIAKMLANDLKFTFYESYKNTAHRELFSVARSVRRKFFTKIAVTAASMYKRESAFSAIEYVTCKSKKELESAHQKNIENGEEGSIIRMPDVGVLADSKWRGNFVKYKAYANEDAVILGVVEGTGRNAGRAGAFWTYLPARKQFTKVTVPGDLVKEWVWKNRNVLHGFWIEIIGAQDNTAGANASRNPVMARFRHDQTPMVLGDIQKLCAKAKITIPSKDNMGVKVFSKAMAKVSL